MKFTCEKSQLSEAVNLASRAVSNKSTIEALEGILISGYGDRLEITGYDLESGISSVIEATVMEPGRIVISCKTLMDIVRNLPDDTVLFESNDKNLITINCGLFESSIMGINASEFPNLPEIEVNTSLTLSYESMKNLIKRTVFAVAVIDNRPILTGVLMEIEENRIKGVAIDGYRLGISKEKMKNTVEKPFKFVVPGKSLNEIGRIIVPTDEEIVLNVTDKHLQMKKGNVTYICRLLEGEFINYPSVIPNDSKTEIKVKTNELIESVERASILIEEKLRTPLFITFEENKIKIDCTSAKGKIHDSLNAEITGEDVKIGVNHKYMLDALKSTDIDEVKINILSNISPVVITPVDSDDFLFIVVPMRI